MRNELGLEVPGHHQAASPLNPDARARALDLMQGECNALVSYVRSLPAPVARRKVTRRRGRSQAVRVHRVRRLPHPGPRHDPRHL